MPRPSRTLWKAALAVVVLFAVVGWLVARPAYKRYRTIREIERLGGTVHRLGPFVEFDNGVVLGGNRFTDDGLKHLSGLTSLGVLLLEDSQVTDEGLKHLSGLTNLELLSLSHTRVTDKGLRHLIGLAKLRQLWLVNTQVTDDGLKHLSGLTNLVELLLYGTQVTDEGVKMLQESLPDCHIKRESESEIDRQNMTE